MQPPQAVNVAAPAGGLKQTTISSYKYTVTATDLQKEQEAFEAGEGVGRKQI